jgi:Ca2+-binding EF-hand superfamily protein
MKIPSDGKLLRIFADAFRRQDRNGDGMLDAGELAAPPR